MSYLDRIRLSFYGDFQADVSTVNNDVRHYDIATFEARFQDPNQGAVENGWWHPVGSNAFRLLNCGVRSVHMADGSTTTDPAIDSAVGLLVGGSNQRVSGKLVDLDPQWQLASQIWGLEVRLIDDRGDWLMRGLFEPTGFRDIQFGRQLNAGAVNGQGASSVFQSVLTDVAWAPDEKLSRSPFLSALKQATTPGFLSIRLTTFGYYTRANLPRFTLGTVTGAIGPLRPSEPRSFIAGRRFAPQNGDRTADGVNFFDARLDVDRRAAFVDLSNAIPLTNPLGAQRDIGALDLVALNDDTIAEDQAVSSTQFTPLGFEIPYRDAKWIEQTAGIYSVSLGGAQATAAARQPWALLVRRPGQVPRVLIRETKGGFHVRCDNFVQRIDAGDTVDVQLFATRFGTPLANSEIPVTLLGPMGGQGGGNPNAPQQPAAPIPDINVPADALEFASSVRTDANGQATLTLQSHTLGEPRGYLDGQIYLLQYSLAADPALVQQQFDFIIIHLRSTYEEPQAPNWEQHIAPMLSQYGNLYPVMSQRIVDLSNYESVARDRAILTLAFSLPVEDPNYMPVTRDLSKAKQRTLIKWLNERNADGTYILRRAPAARETSALAEAAPLAKAGAPSAEADTPLARSVAAAQLLKGRGEPNAGT